MEHLVLFLSLFMVAAVALGLLALLLLAVEVLSQS
jgi:hypothetical protein